MQEYAVLLLWRKNGAAAIFPPSVLIFGLPTQKNMLKYAVLILWRKKALLLIFTLFASLSVYQGLQLAAEVKRDSFKLLCRECSVCY